MNISNTSVQPSVQTIEWSMLNKKKFYSLSFLNSFAIRCVLYPLTVIRTRLQVQQAHSIYKGTIDAYLKILKYEGFRGFYKGFWVNSIQIVSGIGYITTYEKVRDLITKHKHVQDNRMKSFIAGGCASVVGQTIIIPFDIISQHMMVLGQYVKTEGKSQKLNPLGIDYKNRSKLNVALDISKAVFRKDGISGFYRGYAASLCVYVPNGAIWWSFYSWYAQLLSTIVPVNTPHLLIQCIAAPMSGVTSSFITNPLDCVRARMQVHRCGTIYSTTKQLWMEERFGLLMKGLTARLMQSVIFSFFIILGYESLKRFSVLDEYKENVHW